MRRAALIFFHVAAALSLLLCVAAVGAWGWGRTAALQVTQVTPLSFQSLAVSRGEVRVWTSQPVNPLNPYPRIMLGWTCRSYPDSDLGADCRSILSKPCPSVAGFFVGQSDRYGYDHTVILLPMWFVLLLFAILPLAASVRHARRRRRARRLNAGRCIACGYDLRATPQRCPECGRAADALGGAAR